MKVRYTKIQETRLYLGLGLTPSRPIRIKADAMPGGGDVFQKGYKCADEPWD